MKTEIRGVRFVVEDPDTGEFIQLSNVIGAEITKNPQEAADDNKSVYGFTRTFETTMNTKAIDLHTLKKITGWHISNNERRRHHEPMRRIRKYTNNHRII